MVSRAVVDDDELLGDPPRREIDGEHLLEQGADKAFLVVGGDDHREHAAHRPMWASSPRASSGVFPPPTSISSRAGKVRTSARPCSHGMNGRKFRSRVTEPALLAHANSGRRS